MRQAHRLGQRVLFQVAIAIGIGILCPPARTQVPSVYGSLSVTVQDQSGAVVPGGQRPGRGDCSVIR